MATPLQFDEPETSALTRGVKVLLVVNVVVLFVQWTLVSDADMFAVLGFQDGSFQRTLWSTVTYMFVHYGAWHLALTMSALVAFGPRLEHAMGTRAFVLYYLWCGVGGAMAHLLFFRSGLLVGASAAVFGVMYAYWLQWPRDEVVLLGVAPVRAWTLLSVLAVATLGAGVMAAGAPEAGGSRLAYLAHLGGLAFGWLYFRTPPAASLDRLRQRISSAPDFADDVPPRAIPRTLPRSRAQQQRDETDEVVAKSKAVAAQQPTVARAAITHVRTPGEQRSAELDRVLDKISSSGLESLSSDERAVLEEMARRLRGEG
jgi:membrane associated rhomboid family serine protease